jgi:hypothetical protein
MTLVIAFVIVIIAVGLMAIGWLITGRSRMQPGACGRDPTKKRDESKECGPSVSCMLCDKKEEEKKP